MTTRYLGAGLDVGGTIVANVGSPSASTDAANKGYVDNLVAGLSWKDEVRAATTANGTLASAFANSSVIDGITLATGDRILLKNQTTQTENGIYVVAASGAPARATDADATAELNNATVFIRLGTVNAGKSYTQTTDNPTVGSSNIVWAQFNAGTVYTASLGVTLSGTDFRLAAGASGAGLTLTTGVLDIVAADTSLTVNADSIQVNPAASGGLSVSSGLKVDSTVARVYSQATNANSTTVSVTHSLGVQLVQVAVMVTSTGEVVFPDIVCTSTSVVTLTFGTAPTLNSLTIKVIG